MPGTEMLHDRSVDLCHPRRIGRAPRLIRPPVDSIPDLTHQAPRALRRPRDLPHALTGREEPLDLVVAIHREHPPLYRALRFVFLARTVRSNSSHATSARGRVQFQETGWVQSAEIVQPHCKMITNWSSKAETSQSAKMACVYQQFCIWGE